MKYCGKYYGHIEGSTKEILKEKLRNYWGKYWGNTGGNIREILKDILGKYLGNTWERIRNRLENDWAPGPGDPRLGPIILQVFQIYVPSMLKLFQACSRLCFQLVSNYAATVFQLVSDYFRINFRSCFQLFPSGVPSNFQLWSNYFLSMFKTSLTMLPVICTTDRCHAVYFPLMPGQMQTIQNFVSLHACQKRLHYLKRYLHFKTFCRDRPPSVNLKLSSLRSPQTTNPSHFKWADSIFP